MSTPISLSSELVASEGLWTDTEKHIVRRAARSADALARRIRVLASEES